MEDLIDTLMSQHWKISSFCDSLEIFCSKGINMGADLEAWVAEKSKVVFYLKNFKELLIAHLHLEDEKLYPVLEKSTVKKTKNISSKYSDEMKLISKKTLSFFETYSHLKVDDLTKNDAFIMDLTTIINIIRRRIKLEEAELYPLYKKEKLVFN